MSETQDIFKTYNCFSKFIWETDSFQVFDYLEAMTSLYSLDIEFRLLNIKLTACLKTFLIQDKYIMLIKL